MNFEKTILGPDDCSRRYDRILRKFLPDIPLSDIYRNIRSGFIRLNGKKASAETKVNTGDELWIAQVIAEKQKPHSSAAAELSTFADRQNLVSVIFENEHILIINKPYGISVQPSVNEPISLDVLIKTRYMKRSSVSFIPGPLHRLDRNTTGLLAFSQSLTGAQWFSKAMAEHIIRKEYVGIAEGHISSPQTWKDTLSSDYARYGFYTEKASPFSAHALGKTAVTQCTPLAYGIYQGKRLTLCRFAIETGRKHQIRVQSASHGFPLAGDKAYHSTMHLPSFNDTQREYFLHAEQLLFPRENPLLLPEKLCAPVDSVFTSFLIESGCAYQL